MDDRDLQLLRRLRDESTPSVEEVAAARRMLNAEIQKEISAASRSRLRRPQLAALAAAAVVVVAFVFSFVGQLVRPAPVTAALTEIAAVVEARVPPLPVAGEGVYVRSVRSDLVQLAAEDVPGAEGQLFSFRLPQTREVWIRADGSRLLRAEVGQPEFFDSIDAELFARAGLSEVFGVGDVELIDFAPPEVEFDVSALPLEPTALRAALLTEAGTSEDPETATLMRMAGIVLRESSAGPELRSAVVEMLAELGDDLEIVTEDGSILEVATEYRVGDITRLRSLTFDVATGALVAEALIAVDVTDDFGVLPGTPIIEATYSIPTPAPLP